MDGDVSVFQRAARSATPAPPWSATPAAPWRRRAASSSPARCVSVSRFTSSCRRRSSSPGQGTCPPPSSAPAGRRSASPCSPPPTSIPVVVVRMFFVVGGCVSVAWPLASLDRSRSAPAAGRCLTVTSALTADRRRLVVVSSRCLPVCRPAAACCKSETGRRNQDRSRRATNRRRILTRPVLIVVTGLGFATQT